jgi:hypothetical protein
MWEFQRTRCFFSSLPRVRRIRYDIELVRTGFLKSGGPKRSNDGATTGIHSRGHSVQQSNSCPATLELYNLLLCISPPWSNDRPLHLSEVESASQSAGTFSAMLFIKRPNERLQFTRKSTSLEIPSRDRGRSIPANLYLPPNAQLNPTSPLPVLINWHGSGFVLPGHGADAIFCARMAETAGIAVLDADYRKGPEHVFPAAINDAEDALRWVNRQPTEIRSSSHPPRRFQRRGQPRSCDLDILDSEALAQSWHSWVVAFYLPADLSIPEDIPAELQVPACNSALSLGL